MSENDSGCLAETQTTHIMIDIETLGTAPGSVIASIGAVAFFPHLAPDHGDFIVEKQLFRVNISSAQSAGLTIDADTVKWWFRQSPEAIAATLNYIGKSETLGYTLGELGAFIRHHSRFSYKNGTPLPPIWAHSPSFDLVLLEAAYRAVDLQIPWRYSQARDTRTLFDIAGVSLDILPRDGVAHDALDDAIHQAKVVGHALQLLGGRK